MKKILFALFLITILGCAEQKSSEPVVQPKITIDEVQKETGTREEAVTELPEKPEPEIEPEITEPAIIEGVIEKTPEVKEFAITAKRFEFNPSTITVNQGDNVRLIITSLDTTHGFYLPDFSINEKIEADKPVTVEFNADKKGTFVFRCNIPCGSGHSSMEGTLIVN